MALFDDLQRTRQLLKSYQSQDGIYLTPEQLGANTTEQDAAPEVRPIEPLMPLDPAQGVATEQTWGDTWDNMKTLFKGAWDSISPASDAMGVASQQQINEKLMQGLEPKAPSAVEKGIVSPYYGSTTMQIGQSKPSEAQSIFSAQGNPYLARTQATMSAEQKEDVKSRFAKQNIELGKKEQKYLQEFKQIQDDMQSKLNNDGEKAFMQGVTESIAQSAPAMLRSVGAGIVGGGFGSGYMLFSDSAANYYAQARTQGMDRDSALRYAKEQGSIEAVTEYIPTMAVSKILSKSIGATPVKEIGKAALEAIVADGGGEIAANFLQNLNDGRYNFNQAVAEKLKEGDYAGAFARSADGSLEAFVAGALMSSSASLAAATPRLPRLAIDAVESYERKKAQRLARAEEMAKKTQDDAQDAQVAPAKGQGAANAGNVTAATTAPIESGESAVQSTPEQVENIFEGFPIDEGVSESEFHPEVTETEEQSTATDEPTQSAVEPPAQEENQAPQEQNLFAAAKQKISRFVQALRENKLPTKNNPFVNYMPVSDAMVAQAKEHGLDLDGYVHVLDHNAVNHVIKNHGDAKAEQNRGQVQVTDSDFQTIVDVIANPDNVEFGLKTNQGLDAVQYTKTLSDGRTVVIEEVRNRRGKLALRTMWKHTTATNAIPEGNPFALTSETLRSRTSTLNNVEENGADVNQATVAPSDSALGNFPVEEAVQDTYSLNDAGNGDVADQTADRTLLETALGKSLAEKVTLKRGADEVGHKAVAEGYHVRDEDQVVINVDNIYPLKGKNGEQLLSRDERLQWVAFHELFHRGVSTDAGSRLLNRSLKAAYGNPVVKELANKIRAYYKSKGVEINAKQAVEEALAELRAAIDGKNLKALVERWGLESRASKSAIQRVYDRVRHAIEQILSKITGRTVSLTDNEVVQLIKDISNKATEQAINPELKNTDNSSSNSVKVDQGSARFSAAASLPKSERIEKLRQSKTIHISGKDIQPSEDLRQYKRNALNYGKTLRGSYVNKDTGQEIKLGRAAIQEVLRHDYKNPDHLQSIAAIPQIIEESIYIDTLENEDKSKHPDIANYDYYVSGLSIGGDNYTVRAVIANSTMGEKYYDHKLSEIEKGDLLEITSRVSTAEISNQSPLSHINDKRLLQILQDNDNASYSLPDDYQRDLMVTHNISAKGILHADKMGGLPFASVAVTKNTNPLTGFGEVTLIGNRDYIDPKGANRSKVFGSDIYSPRYPTVHYQVTGHNAGEFLDKLKETANEIDDVSSLRKIDYVINSQKDNTDSIQDVLKNSYAVRYQFIKDSKLPFEVAYMEKGDSEFANFPSFKKAVEKHNGVESEILNDSEFFKDFVNDFIDYYKSFQDSGSPIAKRVADRRLNMIESEIQKAESLDNLNKRPLIRAYIEKALESIDENSKIDTYNTVKKINSLIDENQDKFNDYVDEITSKFNIKEWLYKGENSEGRRLYMRHTLDNVAKVLKKDIRAGESFDYGIATLRAKITPQFRSILDIQQNKYRLLDSNEFNVVKDAVENEAEQLASDLGISVYDLSNLLFNTIEDGIEAAFGYADIKMTKQKASAVADFLELLRQMPTEYFEGKAKEITQFSDFAGAVVPDNLPKNARDVLEKSGLKLYEYKSESTASRAEKVKQATEELDQTEGNILFSINEPEDAVGAISNEDRRGWIGFAYTGMDSFVRKLQDKFRPIKQLQDAIAANGGKVNLDNNTYLAEERYHGQVENDLRLLRKRFVKPLVELMQKYGITQKALDDFLIMRHAQERNEVIAKRNKAMPDGGSGVKTADAQAYLADLKEKGLYGKFMDVAQIVYNMNELQRQVMASNGLVSDDVVNTWNKQYKYYVPLKGIAQDNGGDKGVMLPRTGRGYNIGGKEVKIALGRSSKAVNPTAQAISDLTEKLVRAQKNIVGKHLLQLVRDNPDKAFWEIFTDEKPDYEFKGITHPKLNDDQLKALKKRLKRKQERYEKERALAAEKGISLPPKDFSVKEGVEVEAKPVQMWSKPNEYFAVKEKGKIYYIKINDPILMNALNKITPTQSGIIYSISAKVNRYLAAMNTSLSPEFVVSNFIRDVQTAYLNLNAEASRDDGKIFGREISNEVMKYILLGKPSRAILAHTREKNVTNPDVKKWVDYYEEFMRHGAKTGFVQIKDTAAQRKELDKMLSEANPTWGMVKKTANAIVNVVDAANNTVENQNRLAAYVAAREAGFDPRTASSLAKNMTVNFNRRGEYGHVISSLYMFANASIQGSANFFRTMGRLNGDGKLRWRNMHRAQKFALLMVAAGFAMGFINRLISDEDDDGVLFYDKIPDFVKERNIIIMKNDGKGGYWKIPLPYGYNIFPLLGSTLESMIFGKQSLPKASWTVTKALLGSFSPISLSDSSDPLSWAFKNIVPSAGKPIAELVMNENFTGAPIHNDNRSFGAQLPNSSNGRLKTPEMYKQITQTINKLTGGSEYRSGWFDMYPETLRHIVNTVGGGALRFWGVKVASTAYDKVFNDIDLSDQYTGNYPFLSMVSAESLPYEDQTQYYKRRDEILQIANERKHLGKAGLNDELKLKLRLYGAVRAADSQLKALRKKRDKLYADKTLTARERFYRMKEIEERMGKIIDRFNKRYNQRIEE